MDQTAAGQEGATPPDPLMARLGTCLDEEPEWMVPVGKETRVSIVAWTARTKTRLGGGAAQARAPREGWRILGGPASAALGGGRQMEGIPEPAAMVWGELWPSCCLL